MSEDATQAENIIADNRYMTIATASADGTPWVSPVFFAYDEQYHFYWVSDKDAHHSGLIRRNERVAIVIFDSRADEGAGSAVYFEARAQELEGRDVEKGIEIFNARARVEEFQIKGTEDVAGRGAWRLYRAVPTKVYLLGDGAYKNGQYIEKKIEIRV